MPAAYPAVDPAAFPALLGLATPAVVPGDISRFVPLLFSSAIGERTFFRDVASEFISISIVECFSRYFRGLDLTLRARSGLF